MADHYVVLTSARNNAGDHLIKNRVTRLLAEYRPDREIIHYDAWKPLNAQQLEAVNGGRAVILAGGPALQFRMYPAVYPLVEDLDAIRVPAILMGVGWKSLEGSWAASHDYPLTEPTLKLLRKVDASGHRSGVRDYHTLNVLLHHGFKNVLVTGCPALYAPQKKPVNLPQASDIRQVSFSLGVQFVTDSAMEQVMKEALLRVGDAFRGRRLCAVFHHSLSPDLPSGAGRDLERFVTKHQEIASWIGRQGIEVVDLAGSVQRMLAHYEECDLHVGYRVHAHILMSSWSKPSVLISEDGRAKALKDVLGGLILDGYSYQRRPSSIRSRLLGRLGLGAPAYLANADLPGDLTSSLHYELKEGYPRMSPPHGAIEVHWQQMKKFLVELP